MFEIGIAKWGWWPFSFRCFFLSLPLAVSLIVLSMYISVSDAVYLSVGMSVCSLVCLSACISLYCLSQLKLAQFPVIAPGKGGGRGEGAQKADLQAHQCEVITVFIRLVQGVVGTTWLDSQILRRTISISFHMFSHLLMLNFGFRRIKFSVKLGILGYDKQYLLR